MEGGRVRTTPFICEVGEEGREGGRREGEDYTIHM